MDLSRNKWWNSGKIMGTPPQKKRHTRSANSKKDNKTRPCVTVSNIVENPPHISFLFYYYKSATYIYSQLSNKEIKKSKRKELTVCLCGQYSPFRWDSCFYMTCITCRAPWGWQPFITSNRPSSHFQQTSCSLYVQRVTSPHDRMTTSCSLTMLSTRCAETVTLFSYMVMCSS